MYYLIPTIAIIVLIILAIWEALAEFARETRKPE